MIKTMQKFKVNKEDDNIRLDRWFKRNKPDVTHALLQKLLRKGGVKLNGKKAQSSVRVAEGDEILLKVEIVAQQSTRKSKKNQISEKDIEKFKSYIIHEDKDLLVINKPHGLASQGGSGIKISVDDIIREINPRYKLIHRLDKDTSGALVIAKKTSIATKLGEIIRERKMKKIYLALVKAVPQPREGKIDLPIAKRGERSEKMEVVSINSKDGKKAVTEYKTLENYGGKFSLIELKPITGRTHQLRVHMAEIGCPIIGDGKYGGKQAFIDGLASKLHLHSARVIIPEMGVDVSAEPSKYFEIS